MNSTFESNTGDCILIINYLAERRRQNVARIEDEDELEFNNALMLCLGSLDTENNEDAYNAWLIGAVLNIKVITYDEFCRQAYETVVTRNDFLGVLRYALELTTKADELRAKSLMIDYMNREDKYVGKPIEKILKNSDLYRFMSEFIIE